MTFRTASRISRLGLPALLICSLLAACGSKPPAAPPPDKPAAPPGPPPVVHSNAALEKCDKPLGSLVVNEDIGSIWYSQLRGYKLPSASAALRVLVQQSGCFVWIDASSGGSTTKTKSGKNTPPSKPDFTLSPSISFTDATGSAAGKSTVEAATTLTLQDNRSTVQLAETEGSARYVEFNTFSPLFSAPSAGASAFVKSPEGQVIAASFVDSYNLLVRAARKYQQPAQQSDAKSSLPSMPNVPNVDLPAKPSVQAPTVQTPSIKTPSAPSIKIK